MPSFTLKNLLFVDMIIAIPAVVVLFLFPSLVIGTPCMDDSLVCQYLRVFVLLFGGRNLIVVYYIFLAWQTNDESWRRKISFPIMVWCFLFVFIWVVHGRELLIKNPNEKTSVAMAGLFGCLYAFALYKKV